MLKRRRGNIYKGAGKMGLKRKTIPFVIKNSAVAGAAVVTGYAGGPVPSSSILQLGTITQDTNYSQNVYNVPFSMSFKLEDVINYSELTALFDMYRIRGVAIKLKYNGNAFDGSNSTGRAQNQPVIKWIADYDDDTAPSSINGFLDNMGVKTVLLNENRYSKMFIRPKVAPRVYQTALADGFAIGKRNQWLNSVSSGVPHYGIKGYIEGLPLGTVASLSSVLQFDTTFYMELKDVQ